MKSYVAFVVTGVVALSLVGCSGGTTASSGPSAEGAAFLVNEEPAGAIGVAEARKSAANDGEIVVVGRIGGSEKPFVAGLAAFTIVDPALKPCPDDEGCPTPWDYCCDTGSVKDNIATIKLTDPAGMPLAKDARELLGVKELATVVVRGKAQRSADGNLSLIAKQVFVKK